MMNEKWNAKSREHTPHPSVWKAVLKNYWNVIQNNKQTKKLGWKREEKSKADKMWHAYF